jgi:asparagine synthase (glutamine-hydrolysing)
VCGIAGIFDTRGHAPVDRDLLGRMTDVLSHRGPDDSGFHLAPGLGLGHRRLSIIDLSVLGHQPLFNEDGSVCVTFNGEIYNFAELVKELAARGHRFRSRCDTEVIVHAWEEWGEDCVKRFQGMYAFAVWDAPRETLFLARDRFGEKPLYYTLLDDGQFLFASELKSLLLHPKVRRDIDPLAIEDYFSYGYIPDPRTIYRGVRKLPPAHLLTLRRGTPVPEPREYWDVHFRVDGPHEEGAVREELLARLHKAVGMRMTADVPLGAFLSGGVDSSTIVAMMAAQSDRPVNTCSIAFDDKRFDESQYAQQVARHFKTDHYSRMAVADDFNLLDRLTGFYDEPFADSSALPTYLVCCIARERATVALSGDGGDEIFAGYRRYLWHQNEEAVRSRLPRWLRRPVFGTLGAIYPKLDWAPRFLRAKSTLENLARDPAAAYFNSICSIPEAVRHRLFSRTQRGELQGYRAIDILRGHVRRAQTDDSLSQIQYADLKTYLPGDILTKVDRASMATSLEVRVPLLDHDLVQWLATLPSSLKMRGHEGKYILKKAMEPQLPHDVLYRQKMGFAVPLKAWFRGPLRDRTRQIVRSGSLVETGIFDLPYLNDLVEQHHSGIADHSSAIWSLLMFESFLRNVHGGSRAAVPPVAERHPSAAVG